MSDFESWPFHVRTAALPGLAVRVHAFRCREALSKPLSGHLLATCEPDERLDARLLGGAISLCVGPEGEPTRTLRGIVDRVELLGLDARRHMRVKLGFVSTLARLRHRVTSRIFQDQSADAIASFVLAEHGIEHVFRLETPCPVQPYRVQHQESDLAFVQRILAQEGLYYFFEHDDGPVADAALERMVVSDGARGYAPLHGDPRLWFRDEAGATTHPTNESVITRLSSRASLAPSVVVLRERDFRRPMLEIVGRAASNPLGAIGEAIAGAIGGPLATAVVDPLLRSMRRTGAVVYDERGDRDEAGDAERLAPRRLDQVRRGARVFKGRSTSARLCPGHTFVLAEHPLGWQDGGYAAISVEHHGSAEELEGGQRPVTYENRFRCVRADVVHRPKAPEKVTRHVIETATVIGPGDSEIHTDGFGRVRVAFHWSAAESGEQVASCFLRVAHGWAGAGFGVQFVPRVGMEVLVGFLSGDLDRPMILGCAYNAKNPHPFMLPQDATKSGIRTQSTPGGAGGNELVFEDKAGEEKVSIVAQKDYAATVRRDSLEEVGGERVVRTAGDDHHHVRGSAEQRVDGDASRQVAGSSRESIEGDRSTQAHGSVTAHTSGDETTTVDGNRLTVVGAADALLVKAASFMKIDGERVERVDGNRSVVAGSEDQPSDIDEFAWGSFGIGAGNRLVLNARETISLQCGRSSIELSPDGITLRSATLHLAGTERVVVEAAGPKLELTSRAELRSDTIRLLASAGSVELDDDARVDGNRVRLKPGSARARSEDDASDPETHWLRLRLTDYELDPYGGKRYELVAGGHTYSGTTAADGLVAHELPRQVTRGDLTLWFESYPTGRTLQYAVQIGDMPDASSVAGAQLRLTNLGYYRGANEGELDEITRRALRHFQADHGIDGSGELCSETSNRLTSAHGH